MTGHFDADLVSIQQARDLVTASEEAMRSFQYAEQADVDRIRQVMVDAMMANAARLGQMAHDETGFGFAGHERLKNEFAAQGCWDAIKDVRACGVLRHDTAKRIIEVGYPVGVIAALAPSTNPTSTAIFKILISVKARDGVVIAPHPTAVESTSEAVCVMVEAAGMPLKYGADHSVSVHAADEEVVMAFALQKPAFRMMVDTWGSLGAVGFTTGLTPSFTLAPGGRR